MSLIITPWARADGFLTFLQVMWLMQALNDLPRVLSYSTEPGAGFAFPVPSIHVLSIDQASHSHGKWLPRLDLEMQRQEDS